ncbi:hypothetical protein ACIQAC_29325 [Streptomyces sp. NPDC088387]|uniref:hypothetical protein n=1 Tax=Streptomyces sp. NPDC088387 TaxID=3365859 RepID=UPI003818DBB1
MRVGTGDGRAGWGGWNRVGGAVLVGLAVVAAFAGFSVFTTWLPGDAARYRDYSAAGKCPAGSEASAVEDCLRDVTLTVESVTNKRKNRAAVLTGPGPYTRMESSFGDPGPVLSGLEKGERVTGTVWDGDVMVIAQGNLRQSTAEEPRDELQMVAAIGTFLWLLAALGLLFGGVRVARPTHPGHFTWRPYGKVLLIVAGVSCGVVGLGSVWTGVPWPVVPSVCGVVVVGTAWFLYRDLRDGRAGAGPRTQPPLPLP